MKYNILAHPSSGEFKEKGSIFTAYAHPITSIDQYKALLTSYKSHNPKACHVCSAYRFVKDNQSYEFYSDDGEPGGSGGLPILNKIKSSKLINVGVYVVRVFGGSLLGIPGLIESYSTAGLSAIDSIKHYRWIQSSKILFSLSYEFEGVFKSLIKDFNAKIVSSTYLDEIEMLVSIENINLVSFIDKSKSISSNKIKNNLSG